MRNGNIFDDEKFDVTLRKDEVNPDFISEAVISMYQQNIIEEQITHFARLQLQDWRYAKRAHKRLRIYIA